MPDWSVTFYDTLAEYVQAYIEAEEEVRAQILITCRDEIAESPLLQEQEVELPTSLCLAIRKEFIHYLDGDDKTNEEGHISAMEQEDTELTAQEREAAARPTDAGDYWTSWNAFRTAQRLFSEDVAQVDADSRDKKNKKAFGARTVAVRDWFNNLPKSKMDEAERVAKKWNEEGTPSKDKMNIYRKKNLRNRTMEFIEALRRSMGVHCVVLAAYEGSDGIKSLYIEPEVHRPGRDRNFTVSSNDCKTWAKQGADLLVDYFQQPAQDAEEKDKASNSDEGEDIPEIRVDVAGNPLLPSDHVVSIKIRQDLIREIFTKAYVKVTKRKRSHTPWLELSHAAADYLDPATIPEGFNICDPSKLTKAQIDGLWAHWRARAEKKLPILRFIKAKRNDVGLVGSSETVQRPPKRKPYVEVSDDDEDEQDALEDVRQEEGTLSSTSKPPPSKRSRLSGQHEEAEDQSPAANGSDRIKFLYSLSKDSSYTAVVDALMALPIFAPSSAPPVSKASLPQWASWRWGKTYLSPEIHTQQDQLPAVLASLRRYGFSDRNKGTAVVLGLGLLLWECWRAIELEEDDDKAPQFLRMSVLSAQSAEQVSEVVKDISDRLCNTNVKEVLASQGPSTEMEEASVDMEMGNGEEQRQKEGVVEAEGIVGEKVRMGDERKAEEDGKDKEARIELEVTEREEEERIPAQEAVNAGTEEGEIQVEATVGRGAKKPSNKKQPAHSPSPGPSTIKKSRSHRKDDSSPRNVRPQRKRMPSRKKRGSDYA